MDKIKLIKNHKYMQDLMVRIAHNSTAIEGNTLTLNQTADLLLNGYVSIQNADLREIYEVVNYKKVMPFLIDKITQKEKLSPELIKEFHKIIMNELLENNGEFKKIPNVILGANFDTTKPYLVSTELKQMCDNMYYRFENSKNKLDKIEAILQAHMKFEKIHPFSDGNGRVGRLMMIYSCFEQNIEPIVIPNKQKNRYISVLRNGDIKSFIIFATEIINNEKAIIEKFNEDKKHEKFIKNIQFDDGEVVAIYNEEEAKKLGIIDFLESAGDINE